LDSGRERSKGGLLGWTLVCFALETLKKMGIKKAAKKKRIQWIQKSAQTVN
jgi:hypothetical protein